MKGMPSAAVSVTQLQITLDGIVIVKRSLPAYNIITINY